MNLTVEPRPVPLRLDVDGVYRIGGTRVTLDTVVEAFLEGATAEEIAQQYPSVPLKEVYQVIAFYLDQQQDVNSYLEARRRVRDQVRRSVEQRVDPAGIRARLMARRAV